jgi:uncharacterized protein YjbJ (UPF0337 family)
MNWNQIEGNWEQFKGKVQAQWGKITGDELDVIAGNRKQLSGLLQERYGKAQEDAEREIDDWLKRNKPFRRSPDVMIAQAACAGLGFPLPAVATPFGTVAAISWSAVCNLTPHCRTGLETPAGRKPAAVSDDIPPAR